VGADGNLLVRWERSAGLRAPGAPAEGALIPNGTGYLLSVGPVAQQLQPRAWAASRWLSLMALPVVAAMPFLLVPAPYGLAGVAALVALSCWLPGAAVSALARARMMRRLERTPLWSPNARMGVGVGVGAGARAEGSVGAKPGLSMPPTGGLVRLRGTVAAQPTVSSLFTGQPVVMATSGCAGAVETRGIDFAVRLDGGQVVRVPAREALLLGRFQRVVGQPSCGPLALDLIGGQRRLRSALLRADGWVGRLLGLAARELTLSPGDPVELCGTVDLEPDPEAQRGFERSPAVRPVLRPFAGMPVLVVRPDAPSPTAAGTVTSDPE
jgi:hypothetical protein